MLKFTGERIVPGADNCEPLFAAKMYQEHIARYAFATQWISGRRVLDVGCGVGYGSNWMARNGAAVVRAFDISPDAVEHARANFDSDNLRFGVESATEFDLGEKFDVVTCFELIEHVDKQDEVIRRIHNALAEDGILVISTPRALKEKRSRFHTSEFTEEGFRKLLANKFPQVHFFFENNHFSSLVTRERPANLSRIMALEEQFTLAQADYFIAVACKSPSRDVLAGIQPMLVLNDDRYVKLLERDRAILESDVLQLREEARLKKWKKLAKVTGERTAARARKLAVKVYGALRASDSKTRQFRRQAVKALRSLVSRIYPRLRATERFIRRFRNRLIGRRRNLASLLPSPLSRGTQCQVVDLVYVVGCTSGESKRYRVHNLAREFERKGLTVCVIEMRDLHRIIDGSLRGKHVIFFRAVWDSRAGVEECLQKIRQDGGTIAYDVDDLIFEPEIVDRINAVQRLEPEAQAAYRADVARYLRFLCAADVVTVPTEFLARRVRALGKAAFVVPNSIGGVQEIWAKKFLGSERPCRAGVRVGYFSGSWTHARDFEECEASLFQAMQASETLRFRLVGCLELPPRWVQFGDRVERIPLQPYDRMLELLGECDINLAPLEMGNPFCESKSELKFFEAGLLEVPTIASRNSTFAAAIEHGNTGYLASSQADWSAHLAALIESGEHRRQMGKLARERVLARYTAQIAARAAAQALGMKLDDEAARCDSATGSPGDTSVTGRGGLRIKWVIPKLIIGGGGHRNILRAAYYLQRFGHHVELFFEGEHATATRIKSDIQAHFYPLDCPVHVFDGDLGSADVVIATHWSTVEVALTARERCNAVMYFVQDFEPLFAPMGSEYILAENTYRLGLYHITSGPWCERILRRDFNAEADSFQFPIDRATYYPRSRQKGNPNIVFFAKPEMPRRCFELGLMALREFQMIRPDVEIIMFGSSRAHLLCDGLNATIRAVLPTISDLAQMYADADLGIVFSTTNPSLVPYEMMACGLPVVDLDRRDNELNYGGRRDLALLADPRPKVMARQISSLLQNGDELAMRRKNGIEFVASFPTEELMARRIEDLILQRLARIGRDVVRA